MTNEGRIAEAERIAAKLKEKPDIGRTCETCIWLKGAEPGYTYAGKNEFCRNPIVKHDKRAKVDGKERAQHIGYSRDQNGICGPDALFWQDKSCKARMKRMLDKVFG